MFAPGAKSREGAALTSARSSAMSSRLAAVRAQGGVSLKHFMLRTEARSLYRDVLRAVKGMDESTATSVRQEARERFAQNANETDVEQSDDEALPVDGYEVGDGFVVGGGARRAKKLEQERAI